MLKETLKRNKGITLIALVVTIIVLLILAGISINMLTADNGIIKKALEAKQETEAAQEEENRILKEYEDLMKKYGSGSTGGDGTGGEGTGGEGTGGEGTGGADKKLPTGVGTTPYLPSNDFSYKEGDLATGLVIKDSNDNEYVWVEVPTTIYNNTEYNSNGAKKPSGSENYANIEACLKAYTKNYASLNYDDTNPDFTVQYQAMLKSVYINGGFWIGRYEAGLEEGKDPRTSYVAISTSDKAVVKQNKIPYNYVTRDEAQELATRMNYNGCTSSLIFGIQWDLTFKYIEEKTVELAEEANKDEVRKDIKSKLITDSTTIGNYYNSTFTLNRGKFAQVNELSKWKAYNSEEKPILVTGSQKRPQNLNENAILLTTGATEATNLQNIYDIAGNVAEWTLEFYDTSLPAVIRGGCFPRDGSNDPANEHSYMIVDYSDDSVGFRVGLWK